jgi:hypothetical protein
MNLQGESKCAYCERKLEAIAYGKREQDVEHFRPKTKVKAWKLPPSLVRHQVALTPVADGQAGYHRLAYHPFNYAASCKPCNSALKKNFFPIAGIYQPAGSNPAEMMSERPYLIFPIGNFDKASEELIHFYGVSPQPSVANGHERSRALVTIEFFKLDDEIKRKNLVRERAAIITALYPQLKMLSTGSSESARSRAQNIVNAYISTKAPHTNYARSYQALFRSNPKDAEVVFQRAAELIMSMS